MWRSRCMCIFGKWRIVFKANSGAWTRPTNGVRREQREAAARGNRRGSKARFQLVPRNTKRVCMPGDRALKSWRTSRNTTMCPFRIARNPIAASIGIIARNHRNGALVSANVLGRIQHFHHRRRDLAGHDDGYFMVRPVWQHESMRGYNFRYCTRRVLALLCVFVLSTSSATLQAHIQHIVRLSKHTELDNDI